MQKNLEQKKLQEFKAALIPFLEKPRQFPWRKTKDPYKILVSEVMLQQTQTGRVVEKYKQFLKLFPTVHVLATAAPKAVLAAWSGLGYNRRALFLQRAAKEILETYKGKIPDDPNFLETLPGIGHYTARAIAAFSFNKPYAFIETNIRTVFLHHFFSSSRKPISDTTLLSLIEQTLDKKEPRHWYAALMDYGAYLKTTGSKLHRKSASYIKQSKFKGSNRELRGTILRLLLQEKRNEKELLQKTLVSKEQLTIALEQLLKEKIIQKTKTYYLIP